jgi:hypothetical protein
MLRTCSGHLVEDGMRDRDCLLSMMMKPRSVVMRPYTRSV